MFAELNRSLQKNGLLGTLKRVRRELIRRAARWYHRIEHRVRHEERVRTRKAIDEHFDYYHDVETRTVVPVAELQVPDSSAKHSQIYEPFLPQPFFEVMERLGIRFEDFILIDFGCGKGRVVLMASDLPFQRVVGVEFSAPLIQAATANLERYRSAADRRARIELVCMDAASFPIPPEPSVYFFYNPFDSEVMERVAANIVQSIAEHPRRCFVVYINPIAGEVWDRLREFEKVNVPQLTMPGCPVAVWTD